MELLSCVEHKLTEPRFESTRDIFDGVIVWPLGVTESLAVLNLGVLSTAEGFMAFGLLVLYLSSTQPTDSSYSFSFE